MTEYRYQTVDLRSNAVLADLDVQNVDFSVKLSGVGELNGSVFVPESVVGTIIDQATIPGRTGLYVLRNRTPIWGGIIWKRRWMEDDLKFQINCKSWESYAYHVTQRLNKNYTSSDQLLIARELITQADIDDYSQITAPTTGTSGRNRQRVMWAYEFKSVGLELEQLAGLEDGFDYRVESYIKGDGSFGRRYLFGYPRLGRTASSSDSTSLGFDYPGNLAPFEHEEDAETSAWRVFTVGAGEGTEMIWKTAQDTAYDTAGWPRLDAVTQYKDVSIPATLQEHANEDLKAIKPPIDTWTFQLSASSDIGLSDFSVGDSAIFRLRSRRWTTPLEIIRRIMGIRVRPGDGGEVEQVQLSVGDEPS